MAAVTPAKVVAQSEAQWLFTDAEIRDSPSIRHGMSLEEEDSLRRKALNFISQVGISLKLPQLTLYTAGIFLNRFMMRHSLKPVPGYPKPLHHYQIAATALFIASKVDENARKTRDFVIACCRVALKKPEMVVDEQTKDFWRWRDSILQNEDVLYEALCFDFNIESPHRLLVDVIKGLRIEHNKKLRTTAWSFVNDSAITTLGIRYSCRTIAVSAVFAAARFCGLDPYDPSKELPLASGDGDENADANGNGNGSGNGSPKPNGKPESSDKAWWNSQGVSLKDIRSVCNYMADMYADSTNAEGGQSMYAGLKTDGESDGEGDMSQQTTNGAPAADEKAVVEEGRRSVKRMADGTPKTTESAAPAEPGRRNSGSEEGEVEE